MSCWAIVLNAHFNVLNEGADRLRDHMPDAAFSVLFRKLTTDSFKLVWNAARSKPAALVQMTGAIDASALLQGTMKS